MDASYAFHCREDSPVKIIFGNAGGHNIGFDLDILVLTRLLVQANFGAGKSYLLRKLMEELFGHIQIIAIDPEGEFATLREKFGFVLVGKGDETPADVRSAGMVAEKLFELRASAVCVSPAYASPMAGTAMPSSLQAQRSIPRSE
jgi:hypothetical protein